MVFFVPCFLCFEALCVCVCVISLFEPTPKLSAKVLSGVSKQEGHVVPYQENTC
jgi:hypothetical protein